MKPADTKVYLALVAHAGRDFEAAPSLRRITTLTGLTRQAVCVAIRRLEGIGAVTVHRGGGATHPNRYTLANGQRVKTVNGQRTATVPEGQTVNARTAKRSTGAHETVNGRQTGTEKKQKKEQTPLPPRGEIDHQAEARVRARRRPAPALPDIPEDLDTEDFRAAWVEWEQHRKEIRHPLKPTTIQAQLRKLAKWGPERAVASIRRSIEQGWQGFFEPKDGNGQADRPGKLHQRTKEYWDDIQRRRTV